MAQDDGQERTEQPTPKRLHDAREKGQVPRSRELNTMALLVSASVGILMLGEGMIEAIAELFAGGLHIGREEIFDPFFMVERLRDALSDGLLALAPFLVLVVIVALLAPMALGGISFSVQSIAFKAEKLNPIKGLGRVFGWKGLIELAKALAKFAIVCVVAVLLLHYNLGALLGLAYQPLEPALADAARLLGWSLLLLTGALVLIAAVDVPFQIWDYNRQLRMTRQEIKDEYKESEGSPEVKGRVRSLQREIARRRMMEEVPKADVVITNPTHYAIALRYDQARMGAPRVVARGADLVALQIRSVASSHAVPILEAPPLARALYFSTKLNQEIPMGLYLAVAQVLAYVYQLRRYHERGGIEPSVPPLDDLPIPEDLRRE